jgi:F420H(2)-dependent quinone reductase
MCNLAANPQALITVGGRTIPVRVRRAHGAEADELWNTWSRLQPSAATFRALAGREIPIFVLEARHSERASSSRTHQ